MNNVALGAKELLRLHASAERILVQIRMSSCAVCLLKLPPATPATSGQVLFRAEELLRLHASAERILV